MEEGGSKEKKKKEERYTKRNGKIDTDGKTCTQMR
jgi:hypothetical protein